MVKKLTLVLGLLILFTAVRPVEAQANLLNNPGLEPPFSDTPQRKIATGWTPWVAGGSPDYYDEQFGSVHSGSRSQAILGSSATFTAGLYQQVTGIPAGTRLRASAYASLFIALSDGFAGTNSRMRIGIDPNGGTNPGDGGIVWSGVVSSAQAQETGTQQWTMPYAQVAVEATNVNTTVTVFLWGSQDFAAGEHRQFWDDATLTALGEGVATVTPGGPTPAPGSVVAPPPTVPQVAQFVQPQGARPDGSIVHTVQSGDTMFAISVAYNVPVDDILQLNNISDARLLRVGQELIIKPAPGSQTGSSGTGANATEEDADAETPEEDSATATPRPTQVAGAPTDENTQQEEAPTKEATAQPSATPQPTTAPTEAADAPIKTAEVEPTRVALTTSVCVTLFDDTNQNRILEPGERSLEGGNIALRQGGSDLAALTTAGGASPECFNDLEPGEYVAVASVPSGYGLTTPNQLQLRVQTGNRLNISFGAAEGFEVAAPPVSSAGDLQSVTVADEEAPEPGLQIVEYIGLIVFALAGLILIGGIGTALMMRRR